MCLANEIARGEMSILYRELPQGANRIETVFIFDLEVLKHYRKNVAIAM